MNGKFVFLNLFSVLVYFVMWHRIIGGVVPNAMC